MPTETPPPAPTVVDTPPPSPPPAPTTELHVDASGTIGADRGPAPEPVKRGSARERMFSDLRKKAGVESSPAPAATTPSEPSPGPEEKTPSPAPESTTPVAPEAGAATTPEAKKKISPWKLVDEYKGRAASLEKELADLKGKIPDPKESEKLKGELESVRKWANELAEEIRYVNYQKHPEFTQKYQKPYEEAWSKAMNELSELTVMDAASGQERPISPQDMLALVNMPLKDAKEKADDLFGEFSGEVMNHRREIRKLFDAQSAALEDARKNGAARDQQRSQQIKQIQEKINQELLGVWNKSNEEVLNDAKYSKYFKPVEGDEEGNQRLARGYEIADKAFSGLNPRDPRLTPEQRADIVRLHSAVRNRAAAFGRTLLHLEKAQAQVAALQAELNKYKSAQPGKGEGAQTPSPVRSASARDEVFGALRKYAH